MSMLSKNSLENKNLISSFDDELNLILKSIFKKIGIYSIYRDKLENVINKEIRIEKIDENYNSINFNKNTNWKQSCNKADSRISSYESKISLTINSSIYKSNKIQDNNDEISTNVMKMITNFLSKYNSSFMTIEPYVYIVKEQKFLDLLFFTNNYKFWFMIISFFIVENFSFEDVMNLINYAIDTCRNKSGKIKIFEFFLIILSFNLIDIEELEYTNISKYILALYKKYKASLDEISFCESNFMNNDISSSQYSKHNLSKKIIDQDINFKVNKKEEEENDFRKNTDLKDYLISSEKQTPKKNTFKNDTPEFNFGLNDEKKKEIEKSGIFSLINSTFNKGKKISENLNSNNISSSNTKTNDGDIINLALNETRKNINSELNMNLLTPRSNITSSEYSVINEQDLNFYKNTDNSFNIETYINDYTKLDENEIIIEESDFLSKGCFAVFKINNPTISNKLYGKNYIFSPLKKFKSREDRISARLSVKMIMEKYPNSVYVPFNLVLFNIAMNENE